MVQSLSVSVAMATYNGEKYILEQLESLAVQTQLPIELVVTDDGSTDRTIEIVEGFRVSSPIPISLYKNEKRLGYGENFLQGVMLCGGDVVLFCDQDDIWLPEKVASVANWVKHSDCLLFMHSADVIDEFSQLKGWRLPDYKANRELAPAAFTLWNFSFTGCTMAVTRKLLEMSRRLDHKDEVVRCLGLGHGDIHFSHDKWFYLLASATGKIALKNQSLVRYRRHSSNTTVQHQKISRTFQERVCQLVSETKLRDLETNTQNLADICFSRARFISENNIRLSADEKQNAEHVMQQYDRIGRFYSAKAYMLSEPKRAKRFIRFWSAVIELIVCPGLGIGNFKLNNFCGLAKALILR